MNIYYYVDANIFINAWYKSYSFRVLPSLWKKIAEKRKEITLLPFIYNEIEPISSADKKLSSKESKEKYPLRTWIDDHSFFEQSKCNLNNFNDNSDNNIDDLSLRMEEKYETIKQSKGAGKNDIRLITYAKQHKQTVVTFEAIQKEKPKYKKNYKIPLICSEENVECIDFIKMIENLKIRI